MKAPKRLPMRLWIKEKLDEGVYPEMKWIDPEEGKFQVSWRHGSRQDWKYERDIKVFREWAVYTGKFNPDQNTEVLPVLCKRWKTNFRCALNSLPEVEQIRKESDGRGQHAKKVYIMRKDSKVKRNRYRRTKEFRKLTTKSPSSTTELAAYDHEIIDIVDQMSDDMSWSPYSTVEHDDLSDIKELLDKDQTLMNTPFSGPWPSIIAC